MNQYSVKIDWETLHKLAADLEQARRGMANQGRGDTIADPFGGAYHGSRYERAGLSGVIALERAARKLQHAAWDAVHTANRKLKAADQVREYDCGTRWYSVDCGLHCEDRAHDTHRGAAWRATHYGGRVHSERFIRHEQIEDRRRRVISQTQAAVDTAKKVHALLDYLAKVGVTEYSPSQEICGIHDGTINLTGLRWLAGQSEETDCAVPLDDTLDIAASIQPYLGEQVEA